MSEFNGYLFSKLRHIHSHSEGPLYILQQFNYEEIVVLKKTGPDQEDPQLHPRLNKKVTIEGDRTISGIVYDSISDYAPVLGAASSEEPEGLRVELELGQEVVQIPQNVILRCPLALNMTLRVNWPYRSVWEGRCPTAQTCDFSIEHEGETIWRWSDGRAFAPVVTPVTIFGGSLFRDFATETWTFSPASIESPGTYTARAVFLASGQEATADFEIEFVEVEIPELEAGAG